MSDFTVGDVATLDYTLTVDDVPTSASVTLTVTAPDGTESTPTVANVEVGSYTADIALTQAGTWTYAWTATGDATDAEAGAFEVLPSIATADLNLIRLLISDLSTPRTFINTELQQLLTLEGSVKLAAAQALDVIASNEALVSKRIRTLDLQTDGPAVAKELRAHATALRAQATAEVNDTDGGAFEFTTDLGIRQTCPHVYGCYSDECC